MGEAQAGAQRLGILVRFDGQRREAEQGIGGKAKAGSSSAARSSSSGRGAWPSTEVIRP